MENFSEAVDETVHAQQGLTDWKGRSEHMRTEILADREKLSTIEALANEGIEFLRNRAMPYEHINPVLPAVQELVEGYDALLPHLDEFIGWIGEVETRLATLASVCAEIQTS